MADQKLTILLVEDDKEDYLILRQMLAKAKGSRFELIWAANYEQGLQQIEQGGITTILVDYSLGSRTGLAFIEEVIARGSPVPMILLTGQGNYEVDLQAMKAGAMDYLTKDEISAPLLERTIRYAIERKQTELRLRKHAVRAELLAKISRDFSEAGLDYRTLLNTIARRISETLGDATIIHLLGEDEKNLDAVAVYHPDAQTRQLMIDRLSKTKQVVGEGLLGEIALTREPRLICNAPPEELIGYTRHDFLPWLEQYPVYNIFVAPLCSRSRFIGTLVVVRNIQIEPITQEDQDFYLDLADRAAMAIENVYLFLEEQRKARQMESLNEATQSLLETLDIEGLYRQILDAAQKAMPAMENGILQLFAPETGELEVYIRNKIDPQIREDVLTRGRKLLERAIQERASFRYEERRPSIRSDLVVPLILHGSLIGTLSLISTRAGAFRQDDLHLLEAFAATTTAAIHNARLHNEVQRMAITDMLTGLLNRRGFSELGKREVDRYRRYGHPLSMIMLDIDNFKTVNDSYGHAFGDEVLRALTDSCTASIRKLDIVGRYGGDEFVILLPETDLPTAAAVARRIHQCFSETAFSTQEGRIYLTASLGVAKATKGTRNLDELIIHADTALYTSKEKGRNRVEVWGD